MPTRRIHDVILGLDQLFTDLIDFDDPLNAQASQQWQSNKVFSFFYLEILQTLVMVWKLPPVFPSYFS